MYEFHICDLNAAYASLLRGQNARLRLARSHYHIATLLSAADAASDIDAINKSVYVKTLTARAPTHKSDLFEEFKCAA